MVPHGASKTNTKGLWLKENWKRAPEILVLSGVILLVCGLFTIPTIFYALPPLQDEDSDNLMEDHNITLHLNTSIEQLDGDLVCDVGFYLDNTLQACIPHCQSWLNITMADTIIYISLMILIIIPCIILFVVAWFQKDTIFIFPMFYFIYICISVVLGVPFLIIGALFKAELLCSSDSLIESIVNSSPFCIISGIMNVYIVAQVILLTVFRALGLGWSILFPFHYRRFKATRKIKFIHVATIVLGVVVLIIPALLPLIHGYTITSGPFGYCVARNIDTTYFTLVLPLSILMAITTSVFVILFWRILKEFMLKRFDHKRSKSNPIIKAEIKIFVIMSYYIIKEILSFSTLPYYLITDDEAFSEFQNYFACQKIGIQPDRDCGDAPDIYLVTPGFIVLVTVSELLQSLLPLVILVFVANFNAVIRVVQRLRLK